MIWLKCSLPFLVPLLYLKGQKTALILRDVSAATLECKESNSCPKCGVCMSVHVCMLEFMHKHSFLLMEEPERNGDYR